MDDIDREIDRQVERKYFQCSYDIISCPGSYASERKLPLPRGAVFVIRTLESEMCKKKGKSGLAGK